MSITVKFEDSDNKDKYIVYPVLMHSESGTVVLFTAYGEGVCLTQGTRSIRQVGGFEVDYTMTPFTPIKGKVTLKNDQ